MTLKDLEKEISNKIFKKWNKESTGHDYYHIQRVVNLAKHIRSKEGGDVEIITISAWLHDCWDDKLVKNIDSEKEYWNKYLKSKNVSADKIEKIFNTIDEVSFRKNKNLKTKSLESSIVQDADRLDAIGAIGIARTFAYGGSKDRILYDNFTIPKIQGAMPESQSTLAHFYEKLLLIKDKMNTQTAKNLAEERHERLQTFLNAFLEEWNFTK